MARHGVLGENEIVGGKDIKEYMVQITVHTISLTLTTEDHKRLAPITKCYVRAFDKFRVTRQTTRVV